jgi:hypothetical protein
MSAETPHEMTIYVAALTGEQSSDQRPSIATAYTAEFNGELVGSAFHVLDRIHHNHRALLHSLRKGIDAIPTGTERVTIVCAYERLIRLGSSGALSTDHRRYWQDVRFHLAGFETTWKLAGETDERQQALLRCLRSLLQDPSLAGPRLATPPRRSRKAAKKPPLPHALSADDAIRAHSNVIDKLEASAECNILSWPQSLAERQAVEVA